MHDNEIPIDDADVRRLINEQFPEWSNLTIERLHSEGTVNVIFRIGPSLAARFPLQPGQSRSALETEAVAAQELSEHTTFPTPLPVAIGEPGIGYSQCWSVQTWIEGATATINDPSASTSFAQDLAAFVGEVRSIATKGRSFGGAGRGGKLLAHDEWVTVCLSKSEGLLDVHQLREMWRCYRQLADHAGDVMTHGDLIPSNVLVAEGRLTGVLDVGGMQSADPSLDLVGGWHLLDDGPREVFRTALSCSDLEWERGQAWAFQQALGLVWYYRSSNPSMSELGRRTLDRLVASAPR
ncbi:aminoglycoside phosphotransferase family protein [soil metagenome]